MRFLCLHGMGLSGSIFEAQMAGITRELSGQHDFFYLDGGIESKPQAGAEVLFSGPYHVWFELPTPQEVQAAVDLIWDVIEEDGPFGGIIGFSQGAALAATFLATDALSDSPLNPFKCAIFISSILPIDLASRTFTYSTVTNNCYFTDTGEPLAGEEITQLIHAAATSGFNDMTRIDPKTEFLHAYGSIHADTKTRITLPTAHIVGTADKYYQQSLRTRNLCLNRVVVEHQLGHDVPRDASNMKKIAACVQSMINSALENDL